SKEVSKRLRASLPAEFDLEQFGPNEKIPIELDKHLIELILQSEASVLDHEVKLQRKTTKGKLSHSTQAADVENNTIPASDEATNEPLNDQPSSNQNKEFSLLNLHSAV
ncbi:DNA-binding protein, partial [Acinetobacter baumannii]|nr:DNA-binding protein [Acinetobacter baumannii]